MQDLTTVFVFTNKIAGWLTEAIFRLGIGCIVLVFAIVVLNKARRHSQSIEPKLVVMAAFALIWGAGWLGCHGFIYLGQTITLSRLLIVYQSEQYKIAAGEIHVVRAAKGSERAGSDFIEVDGIEFEIKTHISTFGYDEVIFQGGKLSDGKYGEIYYYDDIGDSGGSVGWGRTILRIDLEQSPELSGN